MAEAIDNVTDEPWEIETLTKIGWLESGYNPNVANCKIKNSFGARGLFQIVPRDKKEYIISCSNNLEEQAELALSRIRESKLICGRMGVGGADMLSLYTSGFPCFKNNKWSRHRYGDGNKINEYAYAYASKSVFLFGMKLLSANNDK